VHKN
jgi:hypothetical protein